jgi:N-acetylmuramoyl-L-alanine amidase
MWVLRRFIAVLGLIALPIGLLSTTSGAAVADAKPAVTDAKLGVEPGLTRVVLNLTGKADYRVFALPDPSRIVVDLSEVAWQIPAGRKLQGRGLVAAMRYGLFKAGTSRVVLDLAAPAKVVQVKYLEAADGLPLRLLIDLKPSDDVAFLATAKTTLFASVQSHAVTAQDVQADPAAGATQLAAQSATKTKPTDPAGKSKQASTILPQLKSGTESKTPAKQKPLIVIDPGHGGIDPGAIGINAMEKNVTLAVAKSLQKQLQASGRFRVVLTRTTDVFIPLRDRFKIAREQQADLFISLHADSHPTGKARGASVYTLSERASDSEAEALATKENKSDVIAGVDLSNESEVVSGILIDLAQRETTNLSSRFATMLVDELKSDTLMLEHSHRFAGFAVLKAPDVPSILLEMGYISSDQDEKLLTDPDYQKKLSKSISRAVQDYFDWHEMVRRT